MYTECSEQAFLAKTECSLPGADAGSTFECGSATEPLPVRQASRLNYHRYIPESRYSSDADARVTGVGRVRVSPGEVYPPESHPKMYSYKWRTGRVLPEHQVVLLMDANGEFESEATGRVHLSGDALIFLFPGVWHRYRPYEGAAWTERWVSLDGDVIRNCLALGGVSPAQAVVKPVRASALAVGFDGLVDSVRVSPANCVSRVLPEAFDLLSMAIEQTTHATLTIEDVMTSPSEHVEDEVVQNALEIIWNDQHSPPLGVADVARLLPVTRRTLDRRFAEVLGRSVLDEINACRFTRAKRLLLETNMPVKAVAYLAGFPSRERMRIMFIDREGLPPSEYRDRNGAKRT